MSKFFSNNFYVFTKDRQRHIGVLIDSTVVFVFEFIVPGVKNDNKYFYLDCFYIPSGIPKYLNYLNEFLLSN